MRRLGKMSFARKTAIAKTLSLVGKGLLVGGPDIPLSNANANPSGSTFYPGQTVAANTVDTKDGAVRAYEGYSTLVPEDLTAWTPSSANISASYVVDRYEVSATGLGAAVLRASFAASSGDKIATFQARLKTGNISNTSSYLNFRTSGTESGERLELSNITPEWSSFDLRSIAANISNELVVRDAGTDGEWCIEIRLMRAVDSTVKHGPQVVGSLAGATIDTDVLSTTSVPWAAQGTIVQWASPYGYSGGDNPASAAGRFFEISSPLMNTQTPGSIQIFGNNTGGSVVEGAPVVISADWDGISHGARFDNDSRISRADTDVPAGVMYIGNRASGDRPFHGTIETWYFPFLLTDAEYALVRQYLLNKNSSLVTY